jgi:uncharacterized Ntn-hydrolase superfamily protein
MTASIVARDATTGHMGVAVQSCMFAVGSTVPWVRPGVGVVAVQAMGDASCGPRCLDALARGASADQALASVLEEDSIAALRQLAVVAADGTAAARTGHFCIEHAGQIVGDGFAVAANMMSTADVWSAMETAFAESTGSLERRMLAALVAAEGAGGDARGRMSAAVVVVDGRVPVVPGTGTLVDVRVDRSHDPLGEVARLLDAHDAYAAFHSGVNELFGGRPDAALASVDEGLGALPREENLRFLRAGALMATGSIDEGIAEVRALIAERPTWEVIVRSFARKGLLTLPNGVTINSVLG